MRGKLRHQEYLYSYVPLEERIPEDHELRPIRKLADSVLGEMSHWLDGQYSAVGRPSIPPEFLIKALLLQQLYGIRSEIQLMEQLNFNMLFRWFVGIGLDEPVWTPESFSTNRQRLFSAEGMQLFFDGILGEAARADLLSTDHFSVDGTLIKAWASQKSFRPKERDENDDSDGENFHGEKRSNHTHASTTDPEARLYRKSAGTAAELCFMGHILMENRNGLIVDVELTVAEATQEREAALRMLDRLPGQHRVTVGGDKGYDVNDFHTRCRELNVTPHIAQRNDGRRSVLDRRTTRHPGYQVSSRKRKLIEQAFGWVKAAGRLRQFMMRGAARNGPTFCLAMTAYNIVRIVRALPAPA